MSFFTPGLRFTNLIDYSMFVITIILPNVVLYIRDVKYNNGFPKLCAVFVIELGFNTFLEENRIVTPTTETVSLSLLITQSLHVTKQNIGFMTLFRTHNIDFTSSRSHVQCVCNVMLRTNLYQFTNETS